MAKKCMQFREQRRKYTVRIGIAAKFVVVRARTSGALAVSDLLPRDGS